MLAHAANNRVISRLQGHFLASLSIFQNASGSVSFWWVICLGTAGILAWDSRHFANPDGVSYVEMASGVLSRGPAELVNGYWSPGYPALITVGLWIFHPRPTQEFPFVHFVNFVIFCLALCAFSFFFRCWLSLMFQLDPMSNGNKRYIIPFAFCTFLWFMLEFIGVNLITPDLCVAVIVFLAAGIACQLCCPGSTWKHYLALGCVLGLGYYAKAAMFPLGFAFLAVLLLCPKSSGMRRQKLFLSASVFLLVAAPLMTLLSVRAGKLSFGEVGRIGYGWYVNKLPAVGWTGGLPSIYGTPEHAPRKLMEKPLTLEFASPISGTYPLWNDPSYWYAGAKVRFDLRQQVVAVRETLRSYRDFILRTAAFVGGAMVLWVLSLREKVSSAKPGNVGWQLAWPIAACSMYALVHVEDRFLGAFLVLFWLGIYGIALRRLNNWNTGPILIAVVCSVMIAPTMEVLGAGARTVHDLVRAREPDYETVAAGLGKLGVQRGDRLALVGSAFYPYYAFPYYARIAGLQVVAQIPNADEFWSLSPPELDAVTDRLAVIGVNAVVARDMPPCSATANWRDVNISRGIRFSILLLKPQPTAH
jgi:hypothetical protein